MLTRQDETLSLKKKARKIGKKIKAVLAAENTHEIMKSFGDRIERFRVMVEQTERLAEKDVLEEPSPSAKLTVREYGAVKSAAGHLYSAFGLACAKHTEHYGYIGLQPTHGRTDRVKFVLAFRSRNQQNVSETTTASKHDTVWLTIESEVQEITSRTQSNGILASLHTSAKRIRESEQTGTTNLPFQDKPLKKERKERPKNKVSFQADSSTRCPLTVPDTTPATPPVTATDVLVNFCNQSNFCTKVKNLFNQPQHPVGRCIGYLEASGTSRHLVYIHSWMNKGAGNNENDKIMALSQVLVDTSQKGFSSGALTVQARLHMSKQLALALLQFHQTRWLRESWSSDDIMLSENQRNAMDLSNKPDDCKEELDAIQEPYANVSIREENATATQPAARQPSPIKNRALFNLGKILLELAFLAPFQKLKLPEEEGSQSTEDAENLIAADRLLCSVSAEMGLDFPEIVRKCIHCDFAQGHDLGSERLQAAFYQYVICGLARCEKKARSSPLLM
jgi:hypothetical protein